MSLDSINPLFKERLTCLIQTASLDKSFHQLSLEPIVVVLLLTVFLPISRDLNLLSPPVNREFKYCISGHSFIYT